ncbi:ABC transporter substrate-binding protein [Streptomyces sp. NBC_01296]|uniref:ABC transporter substrate-binding protein n=1 Tax=Streptomyces sp. NBC_01296 TaxID=2903816 RepID=UPI002E106F59|nr:ABC transporter substrate-binding protein [Streptomyces sp. NBC_01296]
MKSVRTKVIAVGLVIGVAAVGAWQLLPEEGRGSGTALRVGTSDAVSSLDPAGAYDAGSWALFSNVFQSLLTIKSGSGTPVPDAASACKFIGQKLTTYQCELRPGLKFAGGRAVTAEDVKHSFDRIKAINSDQGPAPLFNTLESVKAEDRTVTFNLSAPDATFPFKIATGAGSIVDKEKYPAKALREDGKADGSGPFTLGAYRPVGSVELKPNPGYLGQAKPARTAVTVRYFKDSAQLNQAWQDHQIEVAHRDMPPDVLAGLNPGLKDTRYQASGGTETRSMVFNVRPGSAAAPLVGADSSMNNGFSDKAVGDLIARTQSFSDRAQAAGDFRELQKLVAQHVPMLPLWQKKDYVMSRDAVSGAQYLSDGTGVWRLWELNWL